MDMVTLSHVSYQYPLENSEVISDLSLTLEAGRVYGLIGANESGKTTLCNIIRGFIPSLYKGRMRGEVRVKGHPVGDYADGELATIIGYSFQNPDDQIFQESIYREIAYGLIKQKRSADDVKRRVEYAAGLCGLSDALQEHPYNLPYSKRKFVTTAAIIAMDPQVIILDEPTAGQDRTSTELLGHIIDELGAQNKVIITITHDMEFVARQFTRVIVMAKKQKRRDGTPMEIFWDEPLLQMSGLKQPYLCQLANLLGRRGVLTIDDLMEAKL